MNEIYVVGHRNPDTDSIVAAMSYAALRNALGDRDYVAAYLGHVSDETQRLLDRFGLQPPQLIQNVRTQVADLDYDTPPALNATVTMDRAWHIMREQRISAIPVVNEDGTLYGTLSAGDIATYSMNTISEPRVEALPLFNLLRAASSTTPVIWWTLLPATWSLPCPRAARICCGTVGSISSCAATSRT